jgi:PAS domain S-box-containing protein
MTAQSFLPNTVTDMSGKHEEKHRAEQQHLNEILKTLPGYLVLLTPDYHVTFANRFFRERFGESHGRRCYEYLFERGEPCEVCETYKVLKTMQPGRWEWMGPDGRIYDVYDFPFTDASGSTMILEMGMDITDQKQAEAQLNEMVLFPTLNPDGVLQVDETGKIRKINPAAAQMGFSVGTLLTDVIADLGKLDLRACITAGTNEQAYETQLGERLLSWTVRGAPELGLAFLYSTDITARKQAMQDLVRATELQNRFFDSIDVHIAYMDCNFNIIRVNNAYAKADGRSPDFFVGKNHFGLYPNKENQEIFQRVVETGSPFSVYEKPFEYMEHPERGVTYWDWNLQPVMGLDGTVEGVVLSLMDVTERVRAQEELEKRANEWKETFNAMSEFVSVHDRDFKILRANQALADHFGKKPEELIGMHCHELFHGTDKPCHNCPHALALKSKRAVTQEINDPRIGCPLLISVSPIFDRNGQVTGGVHIAKDITRQKETEERLHSLSRRLVEIQENERLYIARELHDEAGQMLALLMLDLVTLESQAHQPEAVLKKVADMEKTLHTVSENLHNVAMALRPASLDHLGLIPALRQHLNMVRERYKLKIDFKVEETQERLPANVETELYRIVQEALTNVVRHAHASEVQVTLTTLDHKLTITIEDNGEGFDPEKVPHAGHLGLFGMSERAEMIGGQLVINSKPGSGTTLMVQVDYIPLVPDYE